LTFQPDRKGNNMAPGKAIRLFCIDCAGSAHEVTDCGGDKCHSGGADKNGVCWFYRHRLGKGRRSLKVIRKMCLWCMGGSHQLVRECREECALHPYRFGRNPARTGLGGRGKPFVSAGMSSQNRLSQVG
jgi:hypothetical protein